LCANGPLGGRSREHRRGIPEGVSAFAHQSCAGVVEGLRDIGAGGGSRIWSPDWNRPFRKDYAERAPGHGFVTLVNKPTKAMIADSCPPCRAGTGTGEPVMPTQQSIRQQIADVAANVLALATDLRNGPRAGVREVCR